ncbi:phage tail protein [Mesorhizobium sp. M1409]|uniref:GTA baseplate fiber-binding domain-containing protein n=1 Tax=Mesorhizobium sp. M1409 TaxID=2957100 RepID=UPI0033392D64
MVWFATPGRASTGAGYGASPISPSTAQQVQPVSADSPYAVGKVLGRPIPIVIGTYKVEGLPVIGGAATIQTITGYDQVQVPIDGEFLGPFGGGSGTPTKTVDVPVYATQQSAQLGYLLAYDPFGDGYELIRLEVNDEVVYDAENGIGASETFRFYGGTQVEADPITKAVIGTKAGAWQGFAMLYLSGYVADSAPSVKAVISNSATNGGGTHEIAWTSTVPSTFTENAAGRAAAYDPTQDVIYQLLGQNEIPGTAQVYLSVLDAVTYAERYRIPLEGSDVYAASSKWIYAIRGSGFVFVRFADAVDVDRVYDVITGKIVSSHEESGEIFDWKIGFPFGQSYIITGFDFGAGLGLPYALIDISGNVSIGRVTGAGSGDLVYGRTTAGTVSFFACASAGTVKESVFNGDAWTTTTVYTSAGVPSGAWYDPQTGYLIVLETVASVSYIRYVNPDTGAIVDSINTASHIYFITTGTLSTGHERYWPRPGYVMMTDEVDDPGKVYLLNIGSKTITTYAQDLSLTNLEFTTGIFDQNKSSYFEAFGDDHWVEHRLPSITPGAMALQDIITKAVSLGRYTPDQLTFEGFGGLTGYGVGILSNSNIRTVCQSIADIYGFKFADTGNGMYFKKPGRDGAFSLDAALTIDDLVFGQNSSIESQDEATIRRVSQVELQYVSKTDYTTRPASFSMPAIDNSIRVEQYSSPLLLTDEDAQTFVTETYFERQVDVRPHAFSITGENRFLPGDVVSVPSGSITYTVQIGSVALNPSDMTCDIVANDFQTAVSTTITPLANTGLSPVAVSLATQYVHLDIPLFRYSDDLGGLGLRQYGVVASRGQAGWGGGLLYRGDTVATLSALLAQAPHNGVIGVCATVLANPLDPFALTDDSTVTIRRTAGSMSLLVDKTEDQVLAGANLAFIGAQGRWEGVGYKTVTVVDANTFTLSGFTIRGYRGTEVFASLHQVGDQFLMIDAEWLKSVSHPLTDLDATKFYKALGLTQNPATGTVFPHTVIGAAETPYACVNLDAAIAVPDGLDLSCDHRSRLAAGLNPANHGEATLAFEWDIYNGATYKRTLTSITNSVHYATADVATDFGADPPAEITFDVFMMSALDILVPGQTRIGAGRGYRARAHIVLDPGDMTADNTIITADSTAFTADAA